MSLVLDGTLGVQVPASSTGNSGAVAWVNFNGTSGASPVIRASYNVASVTRTSAGTYTIVFSNALVDANYCVIGSSSTNGSVPSSGLQINSTSYGGSWALVTPTTTQFGIGVLYYNGAAALDATYVSVAVFR